MSVSVKTYELLTVNLEQADHRRLDRHNRHTNRICTHYYRRALIYKEISRSNFRIRNNLGPTCFPTVKNHIQKRLRTFSIDLRSPLRSLPNQLVRMPASGVPGSDRYRVPLAALSWRNKFAWNTLSLRRSNAYRYPQATRRRWQCLINCNSSIRSSS